MSIHVAHINDGHVKDKPDYATMAWTAQITAGVLICAEIDMQDMAVDPIK